MSYIGLHSIARRVKKYQSILPRDLLGLSLSDCHPTKVLYSMGGLRYDVDLSTIA
jgi:hypothetical protein